MSNFLGQLGEMYNLSPATLAGLANASGMPAQPDAAGPPPPPPQDDPWSDANVAAHDPFNPANADKKAMESAPGKGEPNIIIGAGIGSGTGVDTIPTRPPADTTPQAPPENADDRAVREASEADQARARQMMAANAAGGGAVVPAHWQPGTHSVAVQRGMDPSELEPGAYNRDVASGHALLGAEKKLEAAQTNAQADAIYAKAHELASMQANDRIQQIYADRDKYVATEKKKLEDLATVARKDIDERQWFKERGTLGGVAAALMIGLNQFATMWSGKGENTALRIINDSIDRNIDAQKANRANAHAALRNEETAYDRSLAAFGDSERATLATKVQYLDQVAAQADQLRANAKSADADAAHHGLIEQIYNERAKAADDLAKLSHTQYTEQMNEHFQPAQRTGPAMPGESGKEELFVPDLGVYARSKEEAVKLRDHGARTQVIVQALKDAQDVYKRAQSTSNPVELARLQQELDSIKARAAVQHTVKEGQGAMSKGDQDVADTANSLLDGSVWRPNGVLESKGNLIGKAITAAQQEHGRYGTGGMRGTEVYVKDAKGNLVPRAVLFGKNAPTRNRTDSIDEKVQAPQGRTEK